MIINIPTLNDTKQVATQLAKILKKGSVVALYGDLGGGKTTFSQYLLKASGVKEHIPSPTYAIVHEYMVSDQLFVHADFYRLEDSTELDLLGFDLLQQKAVITVIEWPKFITPDVEIYLEDTSPKTMKIIGDDQLISRLSDLL